MKSLQLLVIILLVMQITPGFGSFIHDLINDGKQAVDSVANVAKDTANSAVNAVVNAANTAVNAVVNAVREERPVYQEVKSIISEKAKKMYEDVWNLTSHFLDELFNKRKLVFDEAGNLVAKEAENVYSDAKHFVSQSVDNPCFLTQGHIDAMIWELIFQVRIPKAKSEVIVGQGPKVFPASVERKCQALLDVILVIDSSNSWGLYNYQKELQFLSDFTSRFNVGKSGTLFGAVLYSDVAQKLFDLGTNPNKDTLAQAIESAPYMNSGENTHTAFDFILGQQMFRTQVGGRQAAKKVFVVLMDGLSGLPDKTRQYASFWKKANVTLVSVGVSEADDQELLNIASSPSTAFRVETADQLKDILNNLVDAVCVGGQLSI